MTTPAWPAISFMNDDPAWFLVPPFFFSGHASELAKHIELQLGCYYHSRKRPTWALNRLHAPSLHIRFRDRLVPPLTTVLDRKLLRAQRRDEVTPALPHCERGQRSHCPFKRLNECAVCLTITVSVVHPQKDSLGW
jgi:hypothetical protein